MNEYKKRGGIGYLTELSKRYKSERASDKSERARDKSERAREERAS